MAVVSVQPYSSSGGGGLKVTERTYTAIYHVITDDVDDGPNTARHASGVPAYRATYAFGNDSDTGVFCTSKKADYKEREGSRKSWVVTCEYSNDGKSCADEQYDSPLDEPAQISGGTAVFTKIIDKDVDGVPIASSAGEPFDPPTEVDDHRHVVRVTKNVSKTAFNLNTLSDYKDCLNDAAFWGLAAGKVKFANFDWELKYLGTCTEYYFTVNFEFEIDTNGWDLVLLDRGFYELVNGERRTILDDRAEGDERYVNQPVWLDGAGAKLEPVAGVYTPVALPAFKIYEQKDFSALTAMGVPDPLYS